MKRLLLITLMLMICGVASAADTEVQDLTDITSPVVGDDMYIVDSPDGSPSSKKINIGNLLAVAADLDDTGEVADDSHSHTSTTLTNASTNLTDTADLLYEAELDTMSELQAQIADTTVLDTVLINTKSKLEGIVTDVDDFAEADGDTYSGVHDFSSATMTLATNSLTTDNYTDNSINDEHIDWGTGASQVSLDDIPQGTTNVYVHGMANGTMQDSFDALTTSTGSVTTMTLEKSGGGDLTMKFSDGITELDCTAPICSIDLTSGDDDAPQSNYIYIPQATKILTKSTTAFPSDAEHIRIGYFFAQSSADVATTGGTYINQNWNDGLFNGDNQGHITHLGEWIRNGRAAGYFSGLGGDGDGGTYVARTNAVPDTVYLKVASGILYQFHRQAVSAVDTSATGKFLVVNDSVSDFASGTDLYDLNLDADGDTMRNLPATYYNLVIGMVGNKSGEYSPLMVNLPTCSYSTQAGAELDSLGCDVTSIPRQFLIDSNTGHPIARLTLKWTNSGSDLELVSTVDLRGSTPSIITGGGGSGHDPVSLAGAGDYISIAGQVITVDEITDGDVSNDLTVNGYMQDTDIDTFAELQSWVPDATIVDTTQIDSSAKIIAIVSDETGTGALVFATSPTMITPTLGAASATSVNLVTITEPAAGATITIADGKTLTATNTVNLNTMTDGKWCKYTAAGTVLNCDQDAPGGAEVNNLETVMTGVLINQIAIGQTGGDIAVYHSLSGDITMDDGGVTTIGNDKVDSQHYVAGSIDLEHMSSQSVDSDNIVNATIAIGDLANGTDGQLITWAADATAAVVVTGTADQVLTSNGAGAAPTFQAAGGGISAGDDVSWTGVHTYADTVTFNGVTTVSTTLTVDRIDATSGVTTVENTLYVDSNGASGITFPTVDSDPCTTLGTGGLFFSTTAAADKFCMCDGANDVKFNTTVACEY